MPETFELLWNVLLDFRKQFHQNPSGLDQVTAAISSEGFSMVPGHPSFSDRRQFYLTVCTIEMDCPGSHNSLFFIDNQLKVQVLNQGILNEQETEFMSFFLPFCVMPKFACTLRRAVSIVHLAQSIDGRMATANHNSRWISNSENLVFVHRMRALSDAILIGSNTLKIDKPALTVRNVDGPNPVKIVIGNSAENFESLLKGSGRVIHLAGNARHKNAQIETINLHHNAGYINPHTILEELYRLGICSVYIEGGAFTTSGFIRERAVDIINFYIAPVIMGSGLSLEFKGIARVEDALELQDCRFMPMGEGMLVSGHLKPLDK